MKVGKKVTCVSSDETLWNRSMDVKVSNFIYTSLPSKWNHQWGLNKLSLTFLDDVIDKNSLAIWSMWANLSHVLAHLKWIFHFLPRCTSQQQAGICWCLFYPTVSLGRHFWVPIMFYQGINSIMKTSFWRFSWFIIKIPFSSHHISTTGCSPKETESVQQLGCSYY